MPHERRRSRKYLVWMKLRLVLAFFVGIGVLAGGWWWLANLGPQGVDLGERDDPGIEQDGDVAAARRDLAALHERSGKSNDVVELEEAIAEQRDFIAELPQEASQPERRRLEELQSRLHTTKAFQINERIAEVLTEAEAATDSSEVELAAEKWREALAMQQEVNRSGASSGSKNFVREERIEQSLQDLSAQPLAAEVSAALEVVRGAAEAEAWLDALAALTTARELQQQINTEFPRTRFAGLAELDEIEREIESLDAAEVAGQVDAAETAGDAAMAEADYETAVLSFESARQAQLRVNREFNRSRFLSSTRVETLEVKRQTASSVPFMAGLASETKAINRLLSDRETARAVGPIEEAFSRVERAFQQLPKSKRLDPQLRLRLGFLNAQKDRLGEIQDSLYERLRPLPGVGELRMLRTEMPQSLYLQVMRVNPSRNAGRAFPVDSVSRYDANSFCERLGWTLGAVVRLPTEHEFRVAVGEAGRADLEAVAEGGSSESQPMAEMAANEAGFFDLLGNVAEWLSPRADQSEA